MAALLPPENCFVRIGTKREAELQAAVPLRNIAKWPLQVRTARRERGRVLAAIAQNVSISTILRNTCDSTKVPAWKGSGNSLLGLLRKVPIRAALNTLKRQKLRELSRAGFSAEGYGRRSVRKEP